MWPYHLDLLARPVPRYTSYPTAAEFTDAVGADAHDAALQALAPGALASLYVHIPFCRDICWYCGCNTERANRRERMEAYLDALGMEVAAVARAVAGRVRVPRISFGGGSPNAMEPVDFVRLVDQLMTAFSAGSAEISVEIDPRGFDGEWADMLGKVGVSRASLGVQTLDADIQQAIGRVQPAAVIADTVRALRDSGVSSLNFDLMYGLPGQTPDGLRHSLSAAVAMQPDRIALFGYAHVPDRVPRQRRIAAAALPDMAMRFRMAAQGHADLVAAGYVPVGFDHFALPHDPMVRAVAEGRLRRNFQGFTDDDPDALIGFGASAISQFDTLFVQNEKASGRYRTRLAAGGLASVRGVRRSAADRERAVIIEDLLCGRDADLTALPSDGLCEARLQPFVDRGLVELGGDRLRLAPGALPYARAIAACFDPYRAVVPEGFSAAV